MNDAKKALNVTGRRIAVVSIFQEATKVNRIHGCCYFTYVAKASISVGFIFPFGGGPLWF